MTHKTFIHQLTGCGPIPLASYLKALGILRLIAEGPDKTAQGWWRGSVFHLETTLHRPDLQQFFLNDYQPTPVVAPWNGGSGFYNKDNQDAITQITSGQAARFAAYRATISACREAISILKLKEKPEGEMKERMLVACRARLPDEALEWLDAAYVLTADGPKYPPLLGTGGNDGRLEFTNNLMQRLLDIMHADSGTPSLYAASWWDEAFFSTTKNDLQKDSILGQFDPGAVDRSVNPWDFVLMIEGSLLFASAAVKRQEARVKGTLSYPFCVNPSEVGYGSAAAADNDPCRAEIWLPLWTIPSTLSELQSLFSEGRAQVHGRPAKNGVDFARAVSTLGTDRGISSFSRYGFHARNGLAYFAVPLGRFEVQPQIQVNLLREIDVWLDSFRRAASSANAPSSAKRALVRLDAAILDLCRNDGPANMQAVLIALGKIERFLARSLKWREDNFQRPVPLLSLTAWLDACQDQSQEFRLAASLAGIDSHSVGPFRQHLEPVEVRRNSVFWSASSSAATNVVWTEGDLNRNLIAVFQRRCIQAMAENERTAAGSVVFPGLSLCPAPMQDIAAFLNCETDDQRLADLAIGLSLLNWKQSERPCSFDKPESNRKPDGIYTILKLCHLPYEIDRPQSRHTDSDLTTAAEDNSEYNETRIQIPLVPEISRRAAAGQISEAAQLAIRRLRGCRLKPALEQASRMGPAAVRTAAALIFPISPSEMQILANRILSRQPDIRGNHKTFERDTETV